MTDSVPAAALWMAFPFVLLLAFIALAPLSFPAWWGRHFPKIALGLGSVTVGLYLFDLGAAGRVLHTGAEYISFVTLIGALYVVAGGIQLSVKGQATPWENCVFLLFGAVLANLLGTTGASMLLIRPWLRMNRLRITGHHVVFFIFIVSNVGGCLTPIGDPPLFLGYLRGVPFWWITLNTLPMWAVATGLLLAMFYCVDRRNYRRLPAALRERAVEPADEWSLRGRRNLIFLAVIVGAVFIDTPPFLREAILLAAAAGSYFMTPRALHESNDFSFHPIREVAILFAGIFATMMPALDWLQTHAAQFGTPTPALFYWATGSLSSVLDNAPTYLSFLSAQMGTMAGAGDDAAGSIATLLARPDQARILVAISVGAVFFGANTYIGNGPNFMVKAIADQQRVATPGFIGYVFRYTLPFMLPTLVVIWWLFFRG